MKCYKLLRKAKDGKLYPLFINRKEATVFNEWLQAECYPTKGFAVRKGWHCCFKPYAPHLKIDLANGEHRVWVECEAEECEKYKDEIKHKYSTGLYSLNNLAKEYSVSKKTVLLIVNPESKRKSDERIKEHWKDYQPTSDERNKIMREHRQYKRNLHKKGKI